jgi:hypothetical protein
MLGTEWASSSTQHQAHTPDGCTFLEVVPGRLS